MAKLNWEKANRQEGIKPKRRRLTGSQRAKRKGAMHDFANRHKVKCFVCKDGAPSQWAKTGWNQHGAWGICVPCVERRKDR